MTDNNQEKNPNSNNTNEKSALSTPPSTPTNDHEVVNNEKDNPVKGFLNDLKNNTNSPNPDHRKATNNYDSSNKGALNNLARRTNGLTNSMNNLANGLNAGANKLGNASRKLNNYNQNNPNTKRGALANNASEKTSNASDKLGNASNSVKNVAGKMDKINKGVQLANNINNIKNNPGEATKEMAKAAIKETVKKKVVTILVSALPTIVPIILIFLIVVIIIGVIVIFIGGYNSSNETNEMGVNYIDECGFTISETNLSKQEFKEKLQDYARKTQSGYYGIFANNADNIYDIATSNNINPELVVVRAAREGFDPGIGNNYWGMNCTNTGGGKDCASYSSFSNGVSAFVKTAIHDGSLTQFMSHYSYIGDYWYNPGGSGLGGCYYADYIYTSDNIPSRVKNACSTSAPSCGSNGGANCTKTTDDDQQAYAMWQVNQMRDTRIKIFGEVDTSFCQSGTTNSVDNIIKLSDSEAWEGLTGTSTNYKTVTESTMNQRMTNITVPIRVWKSNSKDNYDTTKTTITLTVNKLLAPLFLAFFNDVYNNAPDFVMKSSEVSCYSYRETTSGGRLSAHAYGAACDINWDTTGNRYGDAIYTKSDWNDLKKDKDKYYIIYKDSDIVKIAHKYTLSWGGEWNSTNDAMHFSFIGDETRTSLQSKYLNNS